MKQLSGKVALVTGASRGIGEQIAKDLADAGAMVIINYRTNKERAEKLVASIKQDGGNAHAVRADISKVSDIEQLIEATVAVSGKIDILVNNAAIGIMKPIDHITEEAFDQIFAINVKGTFFTTQHALKFMHEGAKIINFSTSVAGQMFPTYSIYAGTKGAVEQFTRQLAKELGQRKININCVAPGPVNTELFREGKSEAQIAQLANVASFNRLGEPEDISKVVRFLVSEDANWITGQTIRVNGGFI